jgi:hypothetical protein
VICTERNADAETIESHCYHVIRDTNDIIDDRQVVRQVSKFSVR